MPNEIRHILAALLLLTPGAARAEQPISFSTLAGNAGYGWVDAEGAAARFDSPEGVAVDASGTVYVADTQNGVIRRVSADGGVATMAGAAGVTGYADGNGAQALFTWPQWLALGPDGNLYVADTGNSTIRCVTPQGAVRTVAGSPVMAGSADGTNAGAMFNFPSAIVADSAGRLYVADTGNSTIRMIVPEGTNWVVTTLAGAAGVNGRVDGTNQHARFYQPWGIAVDAETNLYVADTGNTALRKVTPSGTNWVTATVWLGAFLGALALDDSGSVYATDSGDDVILRIAKSGTNWVSTVLAGRRGVAGSADGPAGTNNALFSYPRGIASSTDGLLCVADTLNSTIRQVTRAGAVSTLAGTAGGPGNADGPGDQARFDAPAGVAVDGQGNLYVADMQNNAIRRIGSSGVVATLAGTPGGAAGSADDFGTNAAFNQPAALVVDTATNLYVADSDNNEIRKLAWAGTNWLVSTVAGRAGAFYFGVVTNVITNAFANVTNVTSLTFYPQSDYLDYSGVITNIAGVITNLPAWSTNTLVVTNGSGHAVTNLVATNNLGGVVASFAIGTTNLYYVVTNAPLFHTNAPVNDTNFVGLLATNAFTLSPAPPLLNGEGTNSIFFHPSGVALDGAGDLYVADGATNGVRVVTPEGLVSSLAGSAGAYTVSAAQFGTNRLWYQSSSVVVDAHGNVFVADAVNNTIREIVPGKAAVTIAGKAGVCGWVDGTNGAARFAAPSGLAMDAQGNLFVADALSDTIRKITPVGANWVVTTVGGLATVPGSADGVGSAARFSQPGGVAVDATGNLYVADTGNSTVRLGQPASAAPVALKCSFTGGSVVLSWPATATGFILESAGSLEGTPNWTVVTNSPATSGGGLWVTNAVGGRAAFFRLSQSAGPAISAPVPAYHVSAGGVGQP